MNNPVIIVEKFGTTIMAGTTAKSFVEVTVPKGSPAEARVLGILDDLANVLNQNPDVTLRGLPFTR